MATEPVITVQVPIAIANALDDELEFIHERLIGHVPENIEAIVTAVRGADRRDVVLVGDDGFPMGPSDDPDDPDEQDEVEDVDPFDSLFDTPEWQAEEAAAERRHEWEVAQRERLDAEFNEWLDAEASEFDRRRTDWWNARNKRLRTEYDAQNND